MGDLVHLVITNENFKKYLIFENNKRANGPYYESLVRGLNARMLNYEHESLPVTANQARNKFKHLISECKALSLQTRTASGIERARVERGYGHWFTRLYELVSTRPSFNPANNAEPSLDDVQINEDTGGMPQEIPQSEHAQTFVPR